MMYIANHNDRYYSLYHGERNFRCQLVSPSKDYVVFNFNRTDNFLYYRKHLLFHINIIDRNKFFTIQQVREEILNIIIAGVFL